MTGRRSQDPGHTIIRHIDMPYSEPAPPAPVNPSHPVDQPRPGTRS
jgi:hypothetical protein